MTKSELTSFIKQEIADRFEKPLDAISDDTDLIEDMGADSLEMTEILVSIEDKLGVRFEDDTIALLSTPAKLAEFMESYLASIDYHGIPTNV
ncbi:acyl carrier protein [Methylomagnum ishizawai]|uniref:Acyl carrier protein n=1 Tax=Methylomagnum ishizawai TaxID=1760988 RepID=A0A1Y6CX68_9GAMM|nr:acyl carrier protein [Methylomagnum ishizawai]SMF95269.1 acyl carrier protein [Methylomagnum ishizawai]